MSATTTTAHLTDVLPAFAAPQPVQMVRQFLDRISTVRVDARGITLQGVTGRTVAWEELQRIELVSRVDDVLRWGLRFTPVGRLPVLGTRAQEVLLQAATSFDPAPVSWLRERSGWVVIRLVARKPVEIERLPGLVVRLYPSVTRAIVSEAERRNIEVVKLGLDASA